MNRISFAALCGVCFVSTASLAQSGPGAKPSSKFYVGIDIGSSKLDASLSHQFFGPDIGQQSGTDTGFKLRAGVQFSRFVALEVGYIDFGDFAMRDIPYSCAPQSPPPCTYELSSQSRGGLANVVGSWPFADHWSLNGRLGAVYVDVSTSEGDPDIPSSRQHLSESGWGLQYGAGLSYLFNPRMTLSLDWAQYDQIALGLTIGGAPGAYTANSSSLASLGFAYRF